MNEKPEQSGVGVQMFSSIFLVNNYKTFES